MPSSEFGTQLPIPPDGLTVASLISAKGAQLRFWIIQANEAAEKKVLKLSGTVDQQRTKLAEYYDLDLTVIPRAYEATAPTIDESIRECQWEDFVKLGAEWKSTLAAGGIFDLLTTPKSSSGHAPILSISGGADTIISEKPDEDASHVPPAPSHSVESLVTERQNQTLFKPVHRADNDQSPSSTAVNSTSHNNINIPRENTRQEAALLDDLSRDIEGLSRCEGLRDIIQQVESREVARIRDRYGPSDGRRGTADPSWSKYKNIVSKRERLYRILSEDFRGDKDRFFSFFTVPQMPKKRKRMVEDEERLRSFRKIVEAAPWCEADILLEHQKEQYYGPNGEFSELRWTEHWGSMNCWEVWREIKKERYEKSKSSA
ncbi:hypothetical protein R3P38DRAFT_3493032 [Favolaschia claudopus]|uniref:Uncharacterized protein n=1 Tax=Favolaschia claudopus TaxID=2862362 RepID=A0AAW0C721_9AGAR